MDNHFKSAIWGQFGAAIDMLENAINHCPEELWHHPDRGEDFWYRAHHTIFWLDYYLEGKSEGFRPPEPFGLEELDPAGVIPERAYTREELLKYLSYCRDKCRRAIDNLTDERNRQTYEFRWGAATYSELLLYNLRHVQHHTAQLYLLLRQEIDSAPGWVGHAK